MENSSIVIPISGMTHVLYGVLLFIAAFNLMVRIYGYWIYRDTTFLCRAVTSFGLFGVMSMMYLMHGMPLEPGSRQVTAYLHLTRVFWAVVGTGLFLTSLGVLKRAKSLSRCSVQWGMIIDAKREEQSAGMGTGYRIGGADVPDDAGITGTRQLF